VVKETTAADDGSWSVTFDPGELPADGPSTIKATATDAAGNTSAEATPDVTVDTATPGVETTPPDAPVLNAVGTVNAAAVAAGVTVSGTAEPNSTVDVTWGALTAQTTADANGDWSVQFPAGQSDPATEITATATDAAGNTSAAGSTAVAVDVTPPSAATVDAVTGDNIVDAGEAAAGVQITGSAEEGDTVEVTWGGIVKTAVAGAGGAWSVTYAAGEIPPDGAQDVSVTVTDAAGNPQTDPATTVSVDVQAVADSGGTGGDDVLFGGAGNSVLFGGAGNDVLVGDSGGSIRNYQFDYWNIDGTMYDEDFNAGNLGDGEVNNSFIGYNPGAQFGGWTVASGVLNDPGTGTGVSGGIAEMRGTADGFDSSGTGGTLL